jgi:hypothetical protein
MQGAFQNHTSMNTKYLIINNYGKRQKIEHIRKYPPHVCTMIFLQTFRVKAIRLRHTAGLVVPADEVHPVGIPQLKTCK